MNSLLGIHKFASLGLPETHLDLSGNGFFVGQHPVLITILLLKNSKGLIEHLFRAHAGPSSMIEHLLLCGFEFEDHGALQFAARHVCVGLYRLPTLMQLPQRPVHLHFLLG